MICGCPPRWLTSVSQPVSAEAAVAHPCPCCHAAVGKRCVGGTAGYLPGPKTRDPDTPPARGPAYVDVCPARLEVQRTLL